MSNQSLQNTSGNAATRNDYQQSINGQGLSAAPTNLQNSSSSLLSSEGLRITSVGSSTFTPVTRETVTSPSAKPAPGSFPTVQIVVGIVVVLVVLAVLAQMIIKSRRSTVKPKRTSK